MWLSRSVRTSWPLAAAALGALFVTGVSRRRARTRRAALTNSHSRAECDAMHAAKVEHIARQLRERTSTRPLSLRKKSAPHQAPKAGDLRRTDDKLDLGDLDRILHIDPVERTCVAEPGVTFEDLVAATLPFGLVPIVVPELRTITVGGAVAGCSIESMSFVHDLASYRMKQTGDKPYHQMMEPQLLEIGRLKTLILHNYYSRQDFWKTWNKPNYELVKAITDPHGVLRGLYEKTCQAAMGRVESTLDDEPHVAPTRAGSHVRRMVKPDEPNVPTPDEVEPDSTPNPGDPGPEIMEPRVPMSPTEDPRIPKTTPLSGT